MDIIIRVTEDEFMTQQASHLRGCEQVYKLKASIDNRTEVAARAWTGRLLLATCLILVVVVVGGGPGAAGRCLLRLLGRLLLQRLLVPGKKDPSVRQADRGRVSAKQPRSGEGSNRIEQKKIDSTKRTSRGAAPG